jgi:hypothetical protein
MKRNGERGALLEGILIGLAVALGGAAIILYGAGRQPYDGAASAVATPLPTSAPLIVATPAPTARATHPPAPSPEALTPTPPQTTATIAPKEEDTVQPEHEQIPREPGGEPSYGLEGMPAVLQAAIAQASTDLSQRLGIGPEQIEMVGFERLFKSGGVKDAPGAPAGWSVRFAAAGHVYVYSVDLRGNVRAR